MVFIKNLKKVILGAITIITAVNCGNQTIHEYLISRESPKQNSKSEEITLQESPRITLSLPSTQDLDDLSLSLNDTNEQRNARLASVSYLRFHIENSTNETLYVDFSDCTFTNDIAQTFRVISRATYQERFTSPAYVRFSYDDLFSFYFINHPALTKKEFGSYVGRVLPNTEIGLPANSKGEQIVPFEFLSNASHFYSLQCPSMGLNHQFTYYSTRKKRQG